MSIRDRRSFQPDRYRVCFQTVAGFCSYDTYSEAEARRRAKIEGGYVLAQWYCVAEDGRTYIDSERLR